ncbi:hypothetical protein [Actinoplanes sp. CA-252034]|uniref:hypothetical protein n=1 Tax=Actinoplanes sp. CA-252034 TaxID=3239906 RepID=UPI003D951F48
MAAFRRWFLVWFSVYAAAQFGGLVLLMAVAFVEDGLPASIGGTDLVHLVAEIALLLAFCLLQGAPAVLLLWILGRKASKRLFRALAVVLFVLVWAPLIPLFWFGWLCAALAVAVTIRQPLPAYYGPTKIRRGRRA